MTSWTSGYVAELDYTHGYYREMSPLILQLAMLSKLQAHRVERPLRYLELGFGQGLSLNIHAAAYDGEYWGTDFNPTQAANARELAAASGRQHQRASTRRSRSSRSATTCRNSTSSGCTASGAGSRTRTGA